MLVDDKLAKEKLARRLDEAARLYRHVLPQLNPFAVIRAEECETWATAIRNTDLTDCQQRMSDIPDSDDDLIFGQQQSKAMNEHSSGTRAEVPPSISDSGTQSIEEMIRSVRYDLSDQNYRPMMEVDVDKLAALLESLLKKQTGVGNG